MNNKKELLKKLPKVDEVLGDSRLKDFFNLVPRNFIVDSIRDTISELRQEILNSDGDISFSESIFFTKIINKINVKNKNNLIRVINATGIVLHTNLGRANLSKGAIDNIIEITKGYSNLEYDYKKGKRGSRHDHVENVICKITGAEAAMVVNNNAAATMLCLSAMAENKKVIVSRGELVEIGGSFRIPEIMKKSGANLVEVGTTNKTKLSDYEENIDEDTGLLMKVHTSNYRIIGFTEDVDLKELVVLGKKYKMPVIYDMGSGLMVDLSKYGINEPTVLESLKTGIDIVLFSGDKLLGGPQAGIIAGKKEYIDKMKKHQLARVLRIDKLTLSALEATFREYLDMENVKNNIPIIKMITESESVLLEKAEKLKELIGESKIFDITIEDSKERVGGGSAPDSILHGKLLKIRSKIKIEKLERMLRKGNIPIVARVFDDSINFYMRTINDDELKIISDRLKEVENYFLERK